ncbi:MAG: hypothetical protein JNK85_26520 [Verrucomicrobiales bacterium]|nr:hypothetical protein [Verrucomicrobiales bacterium]
MPGPYGPVQSLGVRGDLACFDLHVGLRLDCLPDAHGQTAEHANRGDDA